VYANNTQFESVESLKEEMLAQWARLDINLLKNLINSMPKRLFEVGRAHGGQINY